MKDIAVCILSFNRPKYLCEAVASVLVQTKSPKKVIIFDNGSDGIVKETVESYLKQGVQWVGTDVTKSANWNFRRAINQIDSEFVFVMHDDDRICTDFIDRQLDFLHKNPMVSAVSCNAYLIDENGKRNGRILRPNFTGAKAELYKCSVDIALRYANDSCIPFSPVVYKTEFVRKVEFREEFGKVCDAVFFCDMADNGIVAYQSDLLYECRIHDGQDSSFFSPDLMDKLENFFLTRKSENVNDIVRLRKLLVNQHTVRNIHRIITALKKPSSFRDLLKEINKLRDHMFSFSEAFRFILRVIKTKLINTIH